MMRSINIVRVVINPRIVGTPLRVLSELRKRGISRLPAKVDSELTSGRAGLNAVSFVRQWLDGEQLSRHDGQWILNTFLPPFPGPAFDKMFTNLLSGRRLSPVSAYVAVTGACPYNCWHCSIRNRPAANISTESWLTVLKDLHELGTSIIGFTGGEPLLRDDLPVLIKAAKGQGAAPMVFSTGAGLDAAKARLLKEAGLWAFGVSLDHPDRHECDKRRGVQGAHDTALSALQLARQAGLYTMINTVATRDLVDSDLHIQLYKIAKEIGVQEFRLVEPMACGKLTNASSEALLSASHVSKIRDFHVSTNRKGRLPKVCAFNQIESPEFFGCGGGTQHMFIDAAGEVSPCDFTPLSFGNVLKTPLGEIWSRMTKAMGAPRRHCFAKRHRSLIAKHANGKFPLAPDASEQVCSEAGPGVLPDYFQVVTGQTMSCGKGG